MTVAFLVATAGLAAGKQVVMFLTKEAVRLATPGYADAIESAGAPPVGKLFAQFADGGGELYACPICFDARRLDHADARAERAHRRSDRRFGSSSARGRRSSATDAPISPPRARPQNGPEPADGTRLPNARTDQPIPKELNYERKRMFQPSLKSDRRRG